jgi:hypothetical protein
LKRIGNAGLTTVRLIVYELAGFGILKSKI